MAGIGIQLNKFYKRRSLFARVSGFAYILGVSVLPMVLVIVAIIVMGRINGLDNELLARRELFSASVLYCFIFSLLAASLFNAVFSRYLSDIIYDEKYAAIRPCFIYGMLINAIAGSAFAIPFYVRAYFVSDIGRWYLFFSYFLFMGLLFSFYSMLYLSITKDYVKITCFYLAGMVVAVLLSRGLIVWFSLQTDFAMLIALSIGFLIVAGLNTALTFSYFRENDGSYTGVNSYFRTYWQIIFSNFLYILSLYVHNFVFWHSDLGMTIQGVYTIAEPYDMASFLALLTSISATAIFISNTETDFHEMYKAFSESLTGGRYSDIEAAKGRMFDSLSAGLLSLVRVQFTISVVLFLLFIIFMPRLGFAGMVMQIYPVLAAGYFVIFLAYSSILYLYYFDDTTGALMVTSVMFIVTLVVSYFCRYLPVEFYGLGLFAGSMAGWVISFFRLRSTSKNLETHIFCRGTVVKRGKGIRPSSVVYEKK
ncbi:MAG: exopolysaccharide Pel transporter PelG [Lachnospiraceae bacterium]|nr:exopolysaccharide Pel transporter PelG [Lachnospiraceae bacterium]